jgi:hypothetical protein
MDRLTKKEIHGQNPVVTWANKQNLAQFENQARKDNPQQNGVCFGILDFVFAFMDCLVFAGPQRNQHGGGPGQSAIGLRGPHPGSGPRPGPPTPGGFPPRGGPGDGPRGPIPLGALGGPPPRVPLPGQPPRPLPLGPGPRDLVWVDLAKWLIWMELSVFIFRVVRVVSPVAPEDLRSWEGLLPTTPTYHLQILVVHLHLLCPTV